jgi:iron-sulfur cluster repair protein YtfE (RIC family)
MENTKPLKRHPALVPLSKDHHFGLLLCWKIRTGIKKEIAPERIIEYVVYFFNDHLKPHFAEEEQFIFVLLKENDEKRLMAEKQHVRLRELIVKIQQKPTQVLELLDEFEKELEQHIRFEERDLFPYIQDGLSENELQKLKAKIEEIHQIQPDEWNDQFWVYKA